MKHETFERPKNFVFEPGDIVLVIKCPWSDEGLGLTRVIKSRDQHRFAKTTLKGLSGMLCQEVEPAEIDADATSRRYYPVAWMMKIGRMATVTR